MTSKERIQFYQNHLDRVSRSFAFCIARLEPHLHEQVGLCYLLCRILDTVEDAPWPDISQQESAFAAFDMFVSADQKLERAQVEKWRARFPKDIPEGEGKLLDDAFRIFSDLHVWDEEDREKVVPLILSMSAGMRYFMVRNSKISESQLKLKLVSDADVNRYCFFVAGVVGEMLVRLTRSPDEADLVLSDSYGFGLFLQKINLLKDQGGDQKEGRELVPNRAALFASCLDDAKAAFRFIEAIPVQETGFRLFCSWSLFIGLASIPHMKRAETKPGAKIPRLETVQILAKIEKRISDAPDLKSYFEELLRDADVARTPIVVSPADLPGETERCLALYYGSLAPSQVRILFSPAGWTDSVTEEFQVRT